MNNLLEVLDTKSKEFENTVSIVTTGAAAGIAISKAINKDQKIGAIVGIGVGLLAYAMFSPKNKLKKENLKLEKQIHKIESKFEK
ncbi:hypothetical protein NZD85_02215 [Empedobacter stercoris]|mgnify:CR=1 FL=1|uniref:YtxH domain-containing protein n=2 Tax=Empedobacter TaxID=59734 RepID=A0ABY8V7G8_9FLAO|nr:MULTISPECIES: hypothetical protein [Empedobacter]MCA4776556.1 hypothetical protein [Empedobacter stercoris]MCA4782043.1 hypothetical protein [Empedobacter stercoris]MCA4808970.1 hypothetical protein [Empedobacter stercoris]MDM1521936.1 hypothetical protein [Empedobacter sp. 225-1]MDM1542205.1 hypothetical protein [Empedobacter sp. 189-2]